MPRIPKCFILCNTICSNSCQKGYHSTEAGNVEQFERWPLSHIQKFPNSVSTWSVSRMYIQERVNSSCCIEIKFQLFYNFNKYLWLWFLSIVWLHSCLIYLPRHLNSYLQVFVFFYKKIRSWSRIFFRGQCSTQRIETGWQLFNRAE